MDDEPIYWSGEPEPTRLAQPERKPPSNVIVLHYQRILARLAWLLIIGALGSIILMNLLPPYQQSNIRMMIRAAREAAAHTAGHPRIALPLITAAFFDATGRYDRAIGSYNSILATDPEFSWAYYARGAAYRSMGGAESAISDLSMAISLNPDLVWAYNMRGLVQRDIIGNYDAARLDFQEAVRIDPDFAWAHVNLARLHPDPDVALTHFQIAMNLGLENRPEIYVHRANAYTRMERYDEALADFTHAHSLDPDFIWIYYYRPRALEPLGDVDAAIEDYEHFLSIYPLLDENTAFARSELRRFGVTPPDPDF